MARGRRLREMKPASGADRPVSEIVNELRRSAPGADYREQSLRIHGLICAKCGREFENADRRLLSVHHKDGNHRNNPPDGSNWENLCVYCHDDEHSRSALGEYYRKARGQGQGQGQGQG